MNVYIRIYNLFDRRVPYKNIVELRGYTKVGLTRNQLLAWADDCGGYVIKSGWLTFEFYGAKGGTDYLALDVFCGWLKEYDTSLVIKQSEDNPSRCYECVHGPSLCPVVSTSIPVVVDGNVKLCEMFVDVREMDGG